MKALGTKACSLKCSLIEEVSMAYRFQVNQTACINCGICMDLCPVRCLDMSRPSGEGEIGQAEVRLSPIPGVWADRPWMMLVPIQVEQCVGCQVCVQECHTNGVNIETKVNEVAFSRCDGISHLIHDQG